MCMNNDIRIVNIALPVALADELRSMIAPYLKQVNKNRARMVDIEGDEREWQLRTTLDILAEMSRND